MLRAEREQEEAGVHWWQVNRQTVILAHESAYGLHQLSISTCSRSTTILECTSHGWEKNLKVKFCALSDYVAWRCILTLLPMQSPYRRATAYANIRAHDASFSSIPNPYPISALAPTSPSGLRSSQLAARCSGYSQQRSDRSELKHIINTPLHHHHHRATQSRPLANSSPSGSWTASCYFSVLRTANAWSFGSHTLAKHAVLTEHAH